MTITFFSNFLNHHQVPISDEFIKVLGDQYKFVSTEQTPDSFLKSGYPNCEDYSYNLLSYKSEAHFLEAKKLAIESDVVIIGSAPDSFIEERLLLNKLTFRYSERWFKDGFYHLFSPRVWYNVFKNHTRYRNKNLYLLCASAYTSFDVSIFGAYPKKCFKWGYFTKVEKLNIESVVKSRRNKPIQLLWVSRFIDWKHPELAILLAKVLKDKGYVFKLKMVGLGVLYDKIKNQIDPLELNGFVELVEGLPNNDVLSLMRESHIFLFTSDKNEGWGAVLNEAMSQGCGVVASNSIGASPYLIKHGYNGLLYKNLNFKSFVENVEKLMVNESMREELSINAYYTMRNIWSPNNAVNNFLILVDGIFNNNKVEIKLGPCSVANVFKK